MAIDSIEKRSKYLDEPNVISDEAVDNIVNSISFFDDEDDKKLINVIKNDKINKGNRGCP